MGNCSRFQLTVESDNYDLNYDLIADFVRENEDAAYAIDEDGDTKESCKWYDHEDHLRDFSQKHPEALFILEAEGEENHDMWIKYFKNGKMQRCNAIITFDPFDETKLV